MRKLPDLTGKRIRYTCCGEEDTGRVVEDDGTVVTVESDNIVSKLPETWRSHNLVHHRVPNPNGMRRVVILRDADVALKIPSPILEIFGVKEEMYSKLRKAYVEYFDWHGERSEPLFAQRLREIKLNDEQILGVIEVLFSTCRSCWDNHNGCQCWNDE